MTFNLNQILIALLSTGGAAFITAIIVGVRSLREGKLSNEESIIKRLNDDAVQAHKNADRQRTRANRAESEREDMRRQRDLANEDSARYRRALIDNNIDTTKYEDDDPSD